MTGSKREKVHFAICCFLWILLAVFLFLILLCGLQKPANNLIPWQMLLGTALAFCLIVPLYRMLESKRGSRIIQFWNDKGLFWISLCVYGIFLFLLSALNRNDPGSFKDYLRVYEAAMDIAGSGEIKDTVYFALNPNNFKIALFLGTVFRIANRIGMDGFYLALALNVAGVCIAIVSCEYLLRGTLKETSSFMAFWCFALFLPIYCNTQAFYTDEVSMCCAIGMLALGKLALEAEKEASAAGLAALGGLVAAFGISVKVTVCIPVIAMTIVFLGSGRASKKALLRVSYIGISALATFLIIEAWAMSHQAYRDGKVIGKPVISYIALGMKGNGGWQDNREFAGQMEGLKTKEERFQYSKAYIRSNFALLFDAEHLRKKLNLNFANGNIGTKDFAYRYLDGENLIYRMFSPWGKYYWRTSQYCFIVLFVIYAVYFCGCLLNVILLAKKKRYANGYLIMADLTLIGNVLFLMLWEANSRQLYNQIPILLLGFLLHLCQISRGKHCGLK